MRLSILSLYVHAFGNWPYSRPSALVLACLYIIAGITVIVCDLVRSPVKSWLLRSVVSGTVILIDCTILLIPPFWAVWRRRLWLPWKIFLFAILILGAL